MRMYAQKLQLTHILSYNCPHPSSSYLCSRESAQAHLRQCNKLTLCTPSCAHSLLEKKVNIIFFFFQPLVYVHNQTYKCRLLTTFENSSGPIKSSRENACMCRFVSAFAARKKMFCFFQRPFVSLIICY